MITTCVFDAYGTLFDVSAAAREAADEAVAAAIDFAESVDGAPSDMFDHAYAELPPEIRRQRDDLLAAVDEHGDDAFLREE